MDTCFVVTKEDCAKVLDRFSRDKYQISNFKVVPFGSEPLGFLGEHSKLLISVKQDNKQHVILQFFMKTVPCSIEEHKEYILNTGVFKKEAMLYKALFNKFQFNTQTPPIPRSFLVKPDSVIILEDLSLQGFSVVKDKSQTLDYMHCKCLTEAVANFHASSIIFEEHNSTDNQPYRIYDHYRDMLYETTFSWNENNARCDWLKTTTATLLAICKKIDAFKNKDVETPLMRLVESMKEYIAPSKKYRNVINHGDLWSNNIMFNYTDNIPKNCVLVDFQMARYSPPCCDFLTFLYLTTTEDFHREHFLDLLDIYYNTFESALLRHHIDAKCILTKQEFLDSCYFYKPAALLESAMFGTIVYLNGDFSKDMLADGEKFDDFMKRDRSKLVCKLFDEDQVYRGRLESVITQLLDHIL